MRSGRTNEFDDGPVTPTGPRPILIDASGSIDWSEDELRYLRGLVDLRLVGRPATAATLVDVASDADYLLLPSLGFGPLHGAILDRLPLLKGLVLYSTHAAAVDLTEAQRRGLLVTSLRSYAAPAVAEFGVWLLGLLARPALVAELTGYAAWADLPNVEIRDRRALVLGSGPVGRALVERLSGAVSAVDVWSWRTRNDPDSACLEDLLRNAQIVFVALRSGPGTRQFLSPSRLRRLPPGVMVVNVGRESLVDFAALQERVERHLVHGYAFERDDPVLPLQQSASRRVAGILPSPHLAWRTEEAMARARRELIQNVAAMLADPSVAGAGKR